MLFLGLLLLAATAAFTGLAIADNLSGGPDYNVTVLGNHIATMNGLALFCAGLALALIFGLGCMMAMSGGLLHHRRSRKYRAVRHDAADNARERDRLAARLDDGSATAQDRSADGGEQAHPGYATSSARGGDPTTSADRGGANRVDAPARQRPRHHARHLFGH